MCLCVHRPAATRPELKSTDQRFGLIHTGVPQLGTNWVTLALNGTNLGLFQIRFQNILALRAKMFWNLIWKSPKFVILWPILPIFWPEYNTPLSTHLSRRRHRSAGMRSNYPHPVGQNRIKLNTLHTWGTVWTKVGLHQTHPVTSTILWCSCTSIKQLHISLKASFCGHHSAQSEMSGVRK